jgi:hypothetical protein
VEFATVAFALLCEAYYHGQIFKSTEKQSNMLPKSRAAQRKLTYSRSRPAASALFERNPGLDTCDTQLPTGYKMSLLAF